MTQLSSQRSPEPATPEESAVGAVEAAAPGAPWWVTSLAPFRSPAGLCALALVLLQALWRGVGLAGGYFTQVDYLHLKQVQERPFAWSTLGGEHSGEFAPVAKLLTWVAHAISGTGWTGVTVLVLLMQTVIAVLLWLILSRLLPGRWVRVPLLGLALFTPLTLPTTFAWDQASIWFPAVLCLLVALLSLLAAQRSHWAMGSRVAAVALVVALLSSDRAVLFPVVLLFVLAGSLEPSGLGMLGRLGSVLRSHLKFWVFVVAAVVARIVLVQWHGAGGFSGSSGVSTAGDVLGEFLRQVSTGVLGGPWHGAFVDSSLQPAQRWITAVGVLACAAIAVLVLRRLRRPCVATAVLGLVVLTALVVPLMVFDAPGASPLAHVARHAADAAVLVVLLAAVALREVTVPRRLAPAAQASPGVLAVLSTVLLVVSSAVTTSELVPHLSNTDDREFVEALAAGLGADPAVVLLDGALPAGVMHPWFGDAAVVSTVAGLLPESPTFAVPSEKLRLVDGLGLLREVALLAPAKAYLQPGSCSNTVTSTGLDVALTETAADGQVVLSLDYLASQDSFVRVQAGEQDVRVPLRKGLGRIQVPMEGGFSSFSMVMAPDSASATACLATAEVGAAVAAPTK